VKALFEVFWCDQCGVPSLGGICGNCGRQLQKKMPERLRPVFEEEVRVLEVITGESLPPFSSFDLWSYYRSYFFKGVKIFELKGGNIFDAPKIEWKRKKWGKIDHPFSFEKFSRANLGTLTALTNEAVKYMRAIRESLSGSTNGISFAFSGGKDSSVVKKLLEWAFPGETIEAIFIDTQMELPETYQFVNQQYPGAGEVLLFSAKAKREPLELWKEFLPPSQVMRWCCSVLKTGPYESLLRSFRKEGPQRTLTFEGIRKDESRVRSRYPRTDFHSKIQSQICARPIFEWNLFEVWAFLLLFQLDFNPIYRKGVERVGCIMCPFGTKKYEHFLRFLHPEKVNPYVGVLRDFAEKAFIDSPDDFIKSMAWKRRRGGKRSDEEQKVFSFSKREDSIVFETPRREKGIDLENLFVPLGEMVLVQSSIEKKVFHIRGSSYEFSLSVDRNQKDMERIEIKRVSGLLSRIVSYVRKQINKYSDCVFCGFCENVCPSKAITIDAFSYKIDYEKCMKCGKCINISSYGCLAKQSKAVGGDKNELVAASAFWDKE